MDSASGDPMVSWSRTTSLVQPRRNPPPMSAERRTIEDEIARARSGDSQALGDLLERFRESLRRSSRRHVGAALGRRMDASDIIQQTFLEAHRGFGQFRGASEGEFVAWLRRIHEFNLAEAIRDHLATPKRAAGRETSLNDSRFGDPLHRRIVSSHTSPSLRAVRLEQAARFLEALELLPPDQREAVRLRHVDGLAIDEIAARLDRSAEAAAGLLKRGLRSLRERLAPREEDASS